MADIDKIEALLRKRLATLQELERSARGSASAVKKYRIRSSEVSKLLGEVRQMRITKAYAHYARQHPRRNGFSPTAERDWEAFLTWYTGPDDLFDKG